MVGERRSDIVVYGLGEMGGAIAWRLLSAGYAVHGLEPLAERRERFEGRDGFSVDGPPTHPAAVLIVAGDPTAACVCARDAVRFEAPIVLHSTVAPETAAAIATDDLAGRPFVDCAMSGGSSAIRQGALTLYAGGDPGLLQGLASIFAAYAAPALRVGPVGAGMRVKLLNNAVLHATRSVLYELLSAARDAGIADDDFIAAVGRGSGRSWVTDRWHELDAMAVTEGLGPDAPVVLQMRRDLAAVASAATKPLPHIDHALATLPQIMERGLT